MAVCKLCANFFSLTCHLPAHTNCIARVHSWANSIAYLAWIQMNWKSAQRNILHLQGAALLPSLVFCAVNAKMWQCVSEWLLGWRLHYRGEGGVEDLPHLIFRTMCITSLCALSLHSFITVTPLDCFLLFICYDWIFLTAILWSSGKFAFDLFCFKRQTSR